MTADDLTPAQRVEAQDALMALWLYRHTPHTPERRRPRLSTSVVEIVNTPKPRWRRSVWFRNDAHHVYMREQMKAQQAINLATLAGPRRDGR